MTLIVFILLALFFVFLVGLCVGSFLNVVIIRAFSSESICFPPSKCPSCNTKLKWYHNIPVLSYLFLKGKCAFCREFISIQYPIIELVTGILFVLVFLKFGIGLNALFCFVFVSLFIILAATDIKEKVVFDIHTYILVGVGLIYNFFNIGNLYPGEAVINLGKISFSLNGSFIAAVVGIIVGILFMEIFARLGYLFAGTRAFGEGDTYIAAGLGALFGWRYLLIVLLYSFVIQIILTFPVFIKKLFDYKDYKTLIAFLTFFLVLFLIKWFDSLNLFGNMLFFIILILLLCTNALYLLKRIIGSLKDKENLTYLPFGPAMVLAGLILIFI